MAVAQQTADGGTTGSVRPWVRAALRCGAVLAAAALAVPAAASAAWAAPGPSGPAPADPLAQARATLGPLLDQLHELYRTAEEATEKYNDASEQLERHRAEVADLDRRIGEKQAQLDAGTDIAAELARAQYRNGSLSAYAEMLLADSPYEALDRGHALQQAGDAQTALLDALRADQAALAALRTRADASLRLVQQLADRQRHARDDVRRRLDEVERTVTSLTGAQRADLERLEKREADEAQLSLLASGTLGKSRRSPSEDGRRAVRYAFEQLGKPYVWGGSGPDVFDCSGLTSQAWLHAGLPIPRTSQQQWAQLRHVPLDQLRPGDLVVYFPGATHVAMYIGAGLIIQAPRPGAFVKVSPMAAMPILGAVRPDPSAADDGDGWKVPHVPGGTDTTTPILGSDIHDGGKPKPHRPAPAPSEPRPPVLPPVPHRPSSPSSPPPKPSAPSSPRPSGTSSPKPTATPSGGTGSGSPSPSATAAPGSPSAPGSPAPASSAPASSDPAAASPGPSGSSLSAVLGLDLGPLSG
ncbi:NlpC/P60 family protein [Streptacidiphilus sp. ASG 303]|uniref:C40 family peptidase n=1 Tax=Streptacidiphilus sp. ASG 303 TaxID=2896847 RepID=UPI001E2CAFB1|nr:NlpC/P60 family protein [Streptacidiphilus sp. ASG 303]MCD0482921.1 NlpC/P60 family protein [Streptacidiphilus sp. ASG 303]